MQAKDLIKEAKKGTRATPCPPKLLAELREILAHNDASPLGKRVTFPQAQALCAEHGVSLGRPAFVAMLRREFGRGWGK